MNKYVIVSDPIRTKEFALVGEINGSICFKPMNALAEQWASENSSVKSLGKLNIPDGMHVSSPRIMTTSISLMFTDESASDQELGSKQIPVQNMGNIFSGRKINNPKNNSLNITNTQIRKVSSYAKNNAVDYKAHAFLGRAKKSSVISAVRSGVGKLNPKSATFSNRENPLIDALAKTAGTSFTRRVAVSSFMSKSKNRLNRRSSTLISMSSEEKHIKSGISKIDIAVSAKAKRFI